MENQVSEDLIALLKVFPHSKYNMNCSLLLLKEEKDVHPFAGYHDISDEVLFELDADLSGVTAIHYSATKLANKEVIEIFFGDYPERDALLRGHKFLGGSPACILIDLQELGLV